MPVCNGGQNFTADCSFPKTQIRSFRNCYSCAIVSRVVGRKRGNYIGTRVQAIHSLAAFERAPVKQFLAPNCNLQKQEAIVQVDDPEKLIKFTENSKSVRSLAELPAARQIVDLLSAWDSLSQRLSPEFLKCNGSQLLLSALKLALPAFYQTPYCEDGRFGLARALEISYTLADLQMDAEVIAAGLLRVAVDSGKIAMSTVEKELGIGTVHLIHDCLRVNQLPGQMDTLEDESAGILRQFSLAFHDVRAVVVELALRVDSMRHAHELPKYRQQVLALENMQIYSPLAHALGLGNLSLELEDVAFKVLFPESYDYVEHWLQSHWGNGETIINDSTEQLRQALEEDEQLQSLVKCVKVCGRCKSRFSTMKKLLKDGRKPDEVYDILGIRVILYPKSGESDEGKRACYRAQNVVNSMWKEVSGRFKDYIAKPKQNGYESLHMTVHLETYGKWGLPMELQIRTSAMDAHAVAGAASHALYKGGLTDPQQVRELKAIMMAAANAAAYRLQKLRYRGECDGDGDGDDVVFKMFDKNEDGVISLEEFEDVIVQLGTNKCDAHKVMEIVDSNTDGCVDAEEFGKIQKQVREMHKNTV